MNILSCYPISKKNFLNWMGEMYGANEETFDAADFAEQCKAISRFLGYPLSFPNGWTNIQIERKVHDYLYLYEKSIRTYPYGVPDYMKILQNMDYQIRDKLEAKEAKKRKVNILPGLNAALIERTNYQTTIAKKEEKEDSIYTTDYSRNYEDCPF